MAATDSKPGIELLPEVFSVSDAKFDGEPWEVVGELAVSELEDSSFTFSLGATIAKEPKPGVLDSKKT